MNRSVFGLLALGLALACGGTPPPPMNLDALTSATPGVDTFDTLKQPGWPAPRKMGGKYASCDVKVELPDDPTFSSVSWVFYADPVPMDQPVGDCKHLNRVFLDARPEAARQRDAILAELSARFGGQPVLCPKQTVIHGDTSLDACWPQDNAAPAPTRIQVQANWHRDPNALVIAHIIDDEVYRSEVMGQ